MRLKTCLIPISAVVLVCITGIASAANPSPAKTKSTLHIERVLRRTHRFTLNRFSLNQVATTSTTDVTVMITGLLSLADSPAGGSPTPKVLYIPDATGGSSPHAAIIMTADTYMPAPLTARKPESEGSAQFLRLSGAEHISFKEVDPAANPLTYSEAAPSSVCATPAETESLYFLPRLSRVGRKHDGSSLSAADLDPAYMSPQSGGPMASVVSIDYGVLTADVEMPIVWEFKEALDSIGGTGEQMIADGVLWTFTIPGDTLTIQSNNTDILQLHADSSNQILLTIANAPDREGIKYLAGTPSALTGKKQKSDEHFPFYYAFMSDKSLTTYKPVALGVCSVGSLTLDPCTLSKVVDLGVVKDCPVMANPPLVGGLNCGPDGLP